MLRISLFLPLLLLLLLVVPPPSSSSTVVLTTDVYDGTYGSVKVSDGSLYMIFSGSSTANTAAETYFWVVAPCGGTITVSWELECSSRSSSSNHMFYDVTSLDPSISSNVVKTNHLPATSTECSALINHKYTLYLENVLANQNVVFGLYSAQFSSSAANVTFNGDSKFLCANTDADGAVSRAVNSQEVISFSD
jgi:hypothetical protein